MPTKIKIKADSRHAPFQGRDGEPVDYYWTKAINLQDQSSIEFGGKNPHKGGEEITIALDKIERTPAEGGGYKYREI